MFDVTWAPFTIPDIAAERRDFYTGFGCCLHYATVIRYATRSKNHSALHGGDIKSNSVCAGAV
jgi:hypothetical protein